MAKQSLNLGTTADDGTGDSLRTAGGKINANFSEVYANVVTLTTNVSTLTTSVNEKAPLDSPALTGVPTAPTANSSASNTQIATVGYVINYVQTISFEEFPASNGQTLFTANNEYSDILVWINGIKIDSTDFSANTPNFTLNDPCANGDTVSIITTYRPV